jgi:hypothetical protein
MTILRGFLFVAVLAALNGCASRLKAGECVQSVNDKHIWRISAVHFNAYTVQAWADGKWGPSRDIVDISYRPDYVKVACPS